MPLSVTDSSHASIIRDPRIAWLCAYHRAPYMSALQGQSEQPERANQWEGESSKRDQASYDRAQTKYRGFKKTLLTLAPPDYCGANMWFKIPASRTPPCANNLSTIHCFSMAPEYLGVSSSRYSFRGAPSVSGSSSSGGQTILQLSWWMSVVHAYGQRVSVSLVCGGPPPGWGFGFGFRGANTSCGADCMSTADSGAGHSSHESA